MLDEIVEIAKYAGLAGAGIAPAIAEAKSAFPWARSIVCTAICYLPPETEIADNKPRGLVARFARSADYHIVLKKKLEILANEILLKFPNSRLEICVDTCPLPERRLAVLSGIAWRGKNGNVFVEGCGSYAALGEIATDIDLPPSEPDESDRCGDCNACMLACPTGAIIAPGEVDVKRCLSYLTQAGGEIPLEFRETIGNRIYGCDVCQEVCPQNREIRPWVPEFAQNVPPGAYPELIPLLKMTPEEFNEQLKESSIGWIRRTRIRRNAAIAAGNLKSEETLPALVGMLEDESAVIRDAAQWALKRIGKKLENTAPD